MPAGGTYLPFRISGKELPMELRDYLSPAQAARAIGVSGDCVRKWMRKGRLDFVATPIGRVVPLCEVERVKLERAERAKVA